MPSFDMRKGKPLHSSLRFLGYVPPVLVCVSFFALWQILAPLFPAYILPAPSTIVASFIDHFETIMAHSLSTFIAAFLGLLLATVLALLFAFAMDSVQVLYQIFYPAALISQTIPLVAVAPLFILWFGFGILPKILAVLLVCFFPVLINLLKSFRSLNSDYADLMRSMGAGHWQIVWHVKLPGSLPAFFAGLRIAATYSVMGAVIGEWLGGVEGLGVYLIRSQRSFATSQLFAAIMVIMLLSLVFFLFVKLCEYLLLPYTRTHTTTIEEGQSFPKIHYKDGNNAYDT